MKLRNVIFLCCASFLFIQIAPGQIPRTLSYQGVLAGANGNPKPDGDYSITFRLYTVASGGGSIWAETQSVAAKRGLFSAILGSTTPFPAFVDFGKQYWMSIQVGADPELTPRIQLTSVGSSFSAIQADVAKTVPDTSLTQAKIGSGQVVKSINNLHDQIVLQGANGASVTTTGDTVTITASGGGGGGIGTLQNTDNTIAITNPAGPTATVNLQSPLTIPGKLGIGSAPYWPFHLKESESTGNGLQARVTNTSTVSNSFASFSLDANSGVVVNQMVADGLGTGPLGMPSGYVGTFSNHSLGLVTNNVERLHIAPGGYIGIGTTNPFYSLDINGFFRTKSVAGGNIVSETDGGTNAWAKFWVKTPARQWSIGSSNNFNGNQLYFSDETGGGTIDMAIMPGGNVGIGTVGPTVKLHVAGSGVLESSVQSTNERAILSLNSTISGQNRIWTLENGIFGIAGLFGIYDRTAGRAALTINTNGVVKAENDAAQSRDKGGFVKAMAYVNGDGSLLRSFNGVNSTAITSTRTTGGYRVNFPFQINDRFVSVTVEDGCCLTGAIASYSFDPNSNSSLLVYVRISGASDGYTTDRPVMVIIY